MARPTKAGLDYFELDCQLEEKVRLIQAEFGLKGFAVVVKLYQKIYGELGYYCEWNNDSLLLFMSENGVSSCDEKNLIQEIISACIRRGIFSEKLFNEFGILTSAGVQKRYLNAVSRRERVELKKEYLLLSVGTNQKNVVINSINADRNEVNVCRNSQSRVEKSRVEKSRVEERKVFANKADENAETQRPEVKQSVEKPLPSTNPNTNNNLNHILRLYRSEIGLTTKTVEKKLVEYLKAADVSLIEYAIEQAVNYNKRNWNYIDRIIYTKLSAGIRSKEDIVAFQRHSQEPIKKSKFNNYKDTNNTDYSNMAEKALDNMMSDEFAKSITEERVKSEYYE